MNEQELQIQRLVDGQLDQQQIRELLVCAEQEPELWREIAAVFVEEQIWRNEVLAEFPPEQERLDSSHPPSGVKPGNRNAGQGPGVKFWLAVAAAVVAGVWLGRVWNPSDTTETPANNSIAAHEDSRPNEDLLAEQTPSGELANRAQPAHRLSVQDVGDVPLYTLEDAKRLGMTLDQQAVPQETVDQLRRNGYQFEQNTQYISGRTHDGRQVVVPIRSVRFNPGN